MILCPHEIVAVHMAGGYALATGRAQAVLVHVDAGTANACMAIQNLFRYRLPVLLFAGRAPYTLHGELTGSRDTYVHFVQDPFDIASIVRPYVKWEYSLPSGIVVKEALARAGAFAHSDPPGPVYMMLPRETLAEEWDDAAMPAYPPARYGSVQAGGIEPARVERDRRGVDGGGKPDCVRPPISAASLRRSQRWTGWHATCGIRVAEFNSIDLNIPQDSPCFAGSDPLPLLEHADLGLLLDSDVPFVPQYAKRADAIEMDPDRYRSAEVGFSDVGISTDMRIQGDCATVLQQVLRSGRGARRRRLSQARCRRIASWSGAREAPPSAAPTASANKGVSGALNPAFVFATLNAKLVAGRRRPQRSDPQRTDFAGAHHAHQAKELCRPCRRRARILRRHGAGTEAGASRTAASCR